MARKPLSQDIIDKIIALRKEKELSSKKIGDELKISPQTVTEELP